MEIISLEKENVDKEVIVKTEEVLRSGKIAIVPTDTEYGIVGDARNQIAIEKMFAIKKRPQEKVFPVFVKSISEARKYAYISDAKARFLASIWPGPITVVFQHKEKLPLILTGWLNNLGLRVPKHLFLLELLSRLEMPLAQTSANISEKPPAKNIEDIKDYFENSDVQPDLVIDGGELSGRASTVIDFTGNEPIVLRTGLVSKEELDRTFRELKP